MGWANKLIGWASGNGAEVNTSGELKTLVDSTRSSIRMFSENDAGGALGTPYLLSPEVDDDFRLRVSNDLILDEEDLTYTTQNFTKHRMDATTFVPSFTTLGWSSNPTNLLTTGAVAVLRTWKTFSMEGTETVALDMEGAITYASGATIPANQTMEVGFALLAITTPFDTFDTLMFRFNSSGVYGVLRNNSNTDVAISPAFNDYLGVAWVPVSGRRYQWITYLTVREAEYWVADPVTGQIWLAGSVDVPPGYGSPTGSQALNVFARHAISGTTTIAATLNVARYNVRRGGSNISTTLNMLSARSGESILSPGTLTTTANQAITTGSITRPAAAVPTNTTALLTSLSGMILETATLAVGTDGILMAYQCPALPTAVAATFAPNRRLRIDAVNIASSIQTALTGGGFSKHYYLAIGSTALSLAGVAADTVTTKAYRRIQLPIVQSYAAAAAAGTLPGGNSSISYALQTAVFINPGEFVALVTYHLGTVATVGVIQHAANFDFSWE
jgi:hypothetical protein